MNAMDESKLAEIFAQFDNEFVLLGIEHCGNIPRLVDELKDALGLVPGQTVTEETKHYD